MLTHYDDDKVSRLPPRNRGNLKCIKVYTIAIVFVVFLLTAKMHIGIRIAVMWLDTVHPFPRANAQSGIPTKTTIVSSESLS
jgi:hypothetical protein